MSITFDLAVIEDNVCSQLDSELQVNMANGNAFRVMRKLGIDADYCGTLTPEQLQAMIPNLAKALADEFTVPQPWDEYDADRLMRLIPLFRRAIADNRLVAWS